MAGHLVGLHIKRADRAPASVYHVALKKSLAPASRCMIVVVSGGVDAVPYLVVGGMATASRGLSGTAAMMPVFTGGCDVGTSVVLAVSAESPASSRCSAVPTTTAFSCCCCCTSASSFSSSSSSSCRCCRCSKKGVRLAQKMQVGRCIPVRTQLQKAEVGPTSGPTRHLSHLWRLTLDPPADLRELGHHLGLYPLVTFEKQVLNMIGNLV